MTAENNEVVSFLRELSSKFNSQRQDVDRLKERSVVENTERRRATGRGRPPCVPCLGAGRREGTPATPDLGAGQDGGSGSAPAGGGRALTVRTGAIGWSTRQRRKIALGLSLPSWTRTKSQTWWRSLRPPRSSLPSGAPWASGTTLA